MGIPIEIVGEGIDWPAWVQAIGSVGAIFLAARLVRLEALHRSVAAMESFKGVIYAAKALVDDVAVAAEGHLVGQWDLKKITPARIDDVAQLLSSTPTFELGSTKAAFELLRLKADVAYLKDVRARFGAGPIPPDNIAEVRLIQQRTDRLSGRVEDWNQGRRWRRAWWWWLWTPKRPKKVRAPVQAP